MNHFKTIKFQQNICFLGVISLREASVNYSDVLGDLLGLAVHHDLGLASTRQDKSFMKQVVSNNGLWVARYSKLAVWGGSDVKGSIRDLNIDPPFVFKTLQGMSTIDVYISDTAKEAAERSTQIVKSVGSDGTKANFSLL